jgi:hypothetical protein
MIPNTTVIRIISWKLRILELNEAFISEGPQGLALVS